MGKELVSETNSTSEEFLLQNYKGLVFDCDGTLINSMEIILNFITMAGFRYTISINLIFLKKDSML